MQPVVGESVIFTGHFFLFQFHILYNTFGDIQGLETVVSVLFTINARAQCTKNEKFPILYKAAGAECSIKKILSSLYIQKVRYL